MRTPTAKQKPRKVQEVKFPVPTGGLISNRNLALPDGQVPGACVLDNWFPTPSSVVLRRGKARHATVAGDLTIKSTFSYVLGAQEQLFAADDDGIWNVTTSTPALVYGGTTNGDWVVLQFSTPGATFLMGVNGVDTGFIYDGTTFWPNIEDGVSSLGVDAVPVLWVAGVAITGGTSLATATIVGTAAGVLYLRDITGTFQMGETLSGSAAGSPVVDELAALVVPGVDGVASADLVFIWAYKQRVFFIEKNSLDAWYLPVDQVGGTAVVLPLGGVFARGGSLLMGQTWSLDSGGSGGLSEQCVFVTTEGEVAAFQGLSPDDANTWSKVGVYQIGKPLGKKAWIRAGGDLVFCTSIGFIPLGQAIKRDYAALGQVAISNPIADEWARAVSERGLTGWIAELWPEGKQVLVAPPVVDGLEPVVFVANADSGAWCRFTGWTPTSFEAFAGRLFMGAAGGAVNEAWVTRTDEGIPYTGIMAPLFNDFGASSSWKSAQWARMVSRASFEHLVRLVARFDWNMAAPTVPDSPEVEGADVWGLGEWGTALWNSTAPTIIQQDRQAVGGSGVAATVYAMVTSGSTVPLNVEIVRLDFAYEVGDAFTG
jgi:hypothetical protein